MKYYKGMNWLERRCVEHTDPVNLTAHIFATLLLMYGLWMHDLVWIVVSIVVGLLGHLYVWIKK